MINIFQIADNDQSIFYLGQIFGNVGFALSGTGPALLSVMFKVFNTAILSLGAIMVTYVTVVGVMMTAAEGEFMGKKWHSIWVPLRMVVGIGILMPTGSGYCVAQILVMWIIVQGVGAADTVWKATVDYVGKGGSLQTISSGPQASNDVTQAAPNLVSQLFASLVCQSAAVKLQAKDASVTSHATFSKGQYSFGPPSDPDACGSIGWNTTDPANVAAGQVLQTLVPQLEILADNYVMNVINDPNCWSDLDVQNSQCIKDSSGNWHWDVPPTHCADNKPNTCVYFGKYYSQQFGEGKTNNCLPAGQSACLLQDSAAGWNQLLTFAGSNFVTDASKMVYGYAANYMQNASSGAASTVTGTTISNFQGQAGVHSSEDVQTYEKAEANGWIFGGALYYFFAKANNGLSSNYQSVLEVFSAKNKEYKLNIDANFSTHEILKNNAVMAFYCGTFPNDTKCASHEGAQGVADAAIQGMQNAAAIGGGGITMATGSAGPMSSGGLGVIKDWTSKLTSSSGTNPLVVIQNFGENCLIAAESLFWVGLALVIVLGFGATNVIALGWTGNYAQGISEALLIYFIPMYFSLISALISVGAMLGVYVPLIPYIIFTFGAIGWMIASIEAMIAAPLIALGMLSPAGQHEILGRSEPAAMILLNIFLRPTLMIFGMMGGMLLSYVVIEFINAAFLEVVRSVIQGNAVGLIEGFLFIMAYAGIIITALNKCFSLIHIVPDRVLRFIGAQPESYGEAESAEAVKGKVQAGGQAAGSAGSTVGSTGAKKGEKDRQDRGQAKQQKANQGGGVGKRE